MKRKFTLSAITAAILFSLAGFASALIMPLAFLLLLSPGINDVGKIVGAVLLIIGCVFLIGGVVAQFFAPVVELDYENRDKNDGK